jgi:glucose-6-phosphate isomerase
VERFKEDMSIPKGKDFLSGRRYSELIKLAQEATEWALVRDNRPNCTIIMPEITPFHWGELIFFFEMATAFEGELLNVNAFDQPGVQGYKNYMYSKLGKPGMPKSVERHIERHPLKKKARFIV